jgi:hypothetical protein
METKKIKAEEYAGIIVKGVSQTSLTKMATLIETKEAFAKKDPLIEALKYIQRDLDSLWVLTDSEKDEIIRLTAEDLGISNPAQLRHIIKEASNENAVGLTNLISQLIREVEMRKRTERK